MTTEEFNSLTASQKRVAIAQDILNQVESKKLIPFAGNYIRLHTLKLVGKTEGRYNDEDDIRKMYDEIETCEVCALGACLMSVTKFNNKLKFSDVGASIGEMNNDKVKNLLSEIFSVEQLLLIECAFEGEGMLGSRLGKKMDGTLTADQARLTEDYYKKLKNYSDSSVDNDKTRLVSIMQNIINNEGEFKP